MPLYPVVLAAQNGVKVSDLNVNAGTVTFNVSWDKTDPELTDIVWSDTVWVFVDYNAGGIIKRLPLTGATLTNPSASAATATVPLPNNKGAWVAGNARSAGSFSATVALYYNSATAVNGECVYASNYPPVGEYVTASSIKFTGMPFYKLVLKKTAGGGTYSAFWDGDGAYHIPEGYTVQSFTDKTGAPGIINCVPSAVYELKATASAYCTGSSVTFALSNAASGRVYRLYRGSNPVDVLAGQGAAATFTGQFAGAGIYTAWVDADGTHCPAAMTGSHNIVANATPTPPTITLSSGNVCYKAGALVFTASSYTGALAWTAAGGGTVSGNSVTFASGASTGTKTVKAQSSQTYANAETCHSAEVTQTGTINVLPTVTGSSGASRCESGTVTLTATPSSGAAIEWYEVSTEGSINSTDNTYTPDVTEIKTYYAQAKHSTTGCVSALPRTEVVATVISNPVITTQPAADTSVCSGSTVTLTVVASPATAYQWRKNGADVTDGTGGTSASYTTAAVTAQANYTVVVGNAGACSTTSKNALVSITTSGCYDTIDPTDCADIAFTYISNVKNEGYMDWNTAVTYCRGIGPGWRLPTLSELYCICMKKSQLNSGYTWYHHWSSDTGIADTAYLIQFTSCSTEQAFKSAERAIKCVQ
jgi:hypothetical protein